jgi:hypothetical protein
MGLRYLLRAAANGVNVRRDFIEVERFDDMTIRATAASSLIKRMRMDTLQGLCLFQL